MGNCCFRNQTDQNEISGPKMQSMFATDRNMQISIEKSCIHLMRAKGGIHTFLIIESAQLSEDRANICRVLTHAGFRPAPGVDKMHKLLCDSQIDIKTWSFPNGTPPPTISQEMIKYFSGTEKHPSWSVEKIVADTLLDIIYESRKNINQTSYTVHGNSSASIVKKINHDSTENYNCAGWAVHMLSELRQAYPNVGIPKKVEWSGVSMVAVPQFIVWVLQN